MILSIRIYVNEIKNINMLKTKSEYYLEFFTPETTKLLRSTKSNITQDKSDENVPHLEVCEVLLVHCNILNNNYQQNLRGLCTFFANKLFVQLLDISTKTFIFLKLSDSEFLYNQVRFTDQNSKLLPIEYKININLVIN